MIPSWSTSKRKKCKSVKFWILYLKHSSVQQLITHQPYFCMEGVYITPYRKMAIIPKNNAPKQSPNFVTFPLYLWHTRPYPFLGSKWQKKGFYSIFVVSSTNFRIIKFVFLAFFEAKMTKIVILDQKLIVPNDYLLFWAHLEWFLSLFQISEVK